MATEKQVQSLAKELARLIGKMDKEYEEKELNSSQEAVNDMLTKEFIKKNTKND